MGHERVLFSLSIERIEEGQLRHVRKYSFYGVVILTDFVRGQCGDGGVVPGAR
jgi:hypothetical protein